MLKSEASCGRKFYVIRNMGEHIVELIAKTVSFWLHILGFYSLYLTKGTNINKSQRVFLMNLSLSEIILCITAAAKRAFILSHHPTVAHQMRITQMTGASMAYYLLMIFLTVDRFSEVHLNIRYPLYWSPQRARYCMAAVWTISVAFTTVFIIYQPSPTWLSYYLHIYFYPVAEYLFCIVALFTYGYIYKVMRCKRKINRVTSSSIHSHKRRKRLVGRIGFFMPSLLILTFVLFVVIPEQTHFYYYLNDKPMTHTQDDIFAVAFSLAFLTDAIIYIFLSTHVRKALKKKVFSSLSRKGFKS